MKWCEAQSSWVYLVAEQDVDACGTLSVHLVDGSQRKVAHTRHLADQFCGGELLEVKSVIHCNAWEGRHAMWWWARLVGTPIVFFPSDFAKNDATSAFIFKSPCKLDAMLCSPFLLLPCLSSRGLSWGDSWQTYTVNLGRTDLQEAAEGRWHKL